MKRSTLFQKYTTHLRSRLYFGANLLQGPKLFHVCKQRAQDYVILSDSCVGDLYGKSLLAAMQRYQLNCQLITIPAGETSKNRQTKEQIEDQMTQHRLGRHTCLLALGGGVITDIGGFVASTYCRGIPYVAIPTTLLGMVDASIGGKTGINLKARKNSIGTIYPPLATFVDLSVLETLPFQEIRNGTIEILKYGLIADRSLFNRIVEDLDKWQQRDAEFLHTIIYQSCAIKTRIVRSDLLEKGKRRILNFGHTLGHAIEAVEHYTLSHGEAVAIGILGESFISYKLGYLNKEDVDEMHSLIKLMKFPLKLSSHVTIPSLLQAMHYDKKSQRNTPRFVTLKKIGKPHRHKGEYCTAIPEPLILDTLEWLMNILSIESSI